MWNEWTVSTHMLIGFIPSMLAGIIITLSMNFTECLHIPLRSPNSEGIGYTVTKVF